MYTSIIRMCLLLAICVSGVFFPAIAQQGSSPIDRYIATAFAQNQGLRQQQFDLDKALFALKEAKAMYLPSVSLLGNYTRSAGGRTIDVPVGDLVNPIYTALNELTASNKYPQLKNESILLNPDNFYDVKMRTSLPLINAEIRYNKMIRQELISSQQASLNVYRRSLVKDIKIAYYHYMQAIQYIEIYSNAALLINENIRQNESMLRNGIRNGTALLRARTELEKNNAALVQVRRNSYNARDYFNFLLNRPLSDSIQTDTAAAASLFAVADTSSGIRNREELRQLSTMQQVYSLDEKKQKSGLIPKLSTYIDLGSQGFDFNVNDKTRYYLWGVNLQWDIFNGGQRKYRAAQSRATLNAVSSQLEETQLSLQLQLNQSFNNYHSAKAAYTSTLAQYTYAGKYYKDQLKAYKAGQLLYLELLDAQTQLRDAGLQKATALANLQISLAELEREQSAYPIDNVNSK